MADAHHHRASSGLKQKNKSHKSSSKRATKRAAGAGRVERLGPGKKAGNAAGAKEKRLQRAKQLRQSKRDELAADRRGLHRGGDAPLNVAVVPLGAACDGAAVAASLPGGAARVGHGDVAGALDAAARADVVVFVMCPTALDDDGAAEAMDDDDGRSRATTAGVAQLEACSPEARDAVAALKAAGLPAVLGVLAPPDGDAPWSGKAQRKRESLARRFFGAEFGDAVPWVDAGAGGVAAAVAALPPKTPQWRARRARLEVAAMRPEPGGLVLEGWVRDAPLSPSRLLHVRGSGAARIAEIAVFRTSDTSGRPDAVLAGDCAEPLETANADDFLNNGEQTWPSADETARAPEPAPETDADYFKAWDVPDDGDGDGDGDGAGDDAMAVDDAKAAAFDEELEFPDEVDVAEDANARDRFARYRALPSFAASDWDVYDSLPRSYAKVHALARYDAARRRAFDAADAPGGAAVGAYVRVVLEVAPGAPPPDAAAPAASQLLQHENRLTVAHFLVKRVSLGAGASAADDVDEEPLASKELLTATCGHRSWPCRPVFSTHALKGAKAKYERFLRRGDHFVCSVFGPLTFGPAPVFLRRATGEVVAAGAALDCDPNRVTLKRAVLTGLPARTHKRKAVVKQMFYNPRDVLYFKPAALTTKHGLTCHITEPIGTHGHFKVALSKPMKQNDTILLTLYKRVYPKLPGGDDDDAPLAIS